MAINLKADQRVTKPKSRLREIRQAGKVPAVVYGKDLENLEVSVDAVEMEKILRDEGNYAVLDLDVEGDQSHQVMVYEVQKDPIKGTLQHIDFKMIRMDELVDSEVNIELTGESPGMADGGILQHTLRTLEIRCLPAKRPEVIYCEIDSLNIGDSVSVADLKIPEDVEVLTNPEETVVSIVPPTREEEADAAAEDSPAEPELVEKSGAEEAEE